MRLISPPKDQNAPPPAAPRFFLPPIPYFFLLLFFLFCDDWLLFSLAVLLLGRFLLGPFLFFRRSPQICERSKALPTRLLVPISPPGHPPPSPLPGFSLRPRSGASGQVVFFFLQLHAVTPLFPSHFPSLSCRQTACDFVLSLRALLFLSTIVVIFLELASLHRVHLALIQFCCFS